MAIEGLGNLYSIPSIKKDQEPGMNQKKKQRKGKKEDREKEEDQHNVREGKIDIRI